MSTHGRCPQAQSPRGSDKEKDHTSHGLGAFALAHAFAGTPFSQISREPVSAPPPHMSPLREAPFTIQLETTAFPSPAFYLSKALLSEIPPPLSHFVCPCSPPTKT